jgi:hypothetical protein
LEGSLLSDRLLGGVAKDPDKGFFMDKGIDFMVASGVVPEELSLTGL